MEQRKTKVYILKNHYKYTYISEEIEDTSEKNEEKSDDITAIAADLFDIDKIEIE